MAPNAGNTLLSSLLRWLHPASYQMNGTQLRKESVTFFGISVDLVTEHDDVEVFAKRENQAMQADSTTMGGRIDAIRRNHQNDWLLVERGHRPKIVLVRHMRERGPLKGIAKTPKARR